MLDFDFTLAMLNARSLSLPPSYFPYSRQSKKKSHRGSITARMIANLLSIAGVDHVITLDLHVRATEIIASQSNSPAYN
jgi:phosphoribosylpyrophosphate synthetase